MKSAVKVRAYSQRFWVEILDILPGLEAPAFKARVDNDIGAMPLKYGDIIYISGTDIIDVYGSGSAKKTEAENKQKILSESIRRLPGYKDLPQYHGWPLIKLEYDVDGQLNIKPII